MLLSLCMGQEPHASITVAQRIHHRCNRFLTRVRKARFQVRCGQVRGLFWQCAVFRKQSTMWEKLPWIQTPLDRYSKDEPQYFKGSKARYTMKYFQESARKITSTFQSSFPPSLGTRHPAWKTNVSTVGQEFDDVWWLSANHIASARKVMVFC